MKLNYHVLSKYRTPLMGIAIISIMCMHYFEDLTIYFSPGSIYYEIGRFTLDVISTFGVEIFLFLSGIGLFFSWQKHHQIISFYKRRCRRILIPYLIVGTVFFVIYSADPQLDVQELFKGLFFITFFQRGFRTFWYILCILCCYLIFPFINHFINDSHHEFRNLSILISITIILNIVLKFSFGTLYDNIEILTTRFPIFMIGTYFGKLVYEKRNISKKALAFYILSMIAAIAFRLVKTRNGLPFWDIYQRYIAALLAIPTMLLLCLICDHIGDINLKILTFFGKHSYEIFLFHMTYRYFFRDHDLDTILPYNEILMLTLSVITAIIFSHLYKETTKQVPTLHYTH